MTVLTVAVLDPRDGQQLGEARMHAGVATPALTVHVQTSDLAVTRLRLVEHVVHRENCSAGYVMACRRPVEVPAAAVRTFTREAGAKERYSVTWRWPTLELAEGKPERLWAWPLFGAVA